MIPFTAFFAASTGFIIASLIPFHTEVAVLLIPLKIEVTVLFTPLNTELTLLFMPSTTEEITDLIPFHTDDATDFTALNIVDTVVLMAFKTDDTLLLIAFHTVEITFFIAPITDEIVLETGKRVTITGVNEGVEYVYDEKALKEIGWIWTVEVWDDVTEPGNLLRKAKSRVAELAKGITSMELSIVDESDAGVDIMDIHARQYVDCLSPPHGIDGRYLCVSKTRDYLNPSGNTITIGASSITLTSLSAKQHGNLNTLEKDIMDQDSKLEDMSGKVEEIQSSKMYRTELLVEGVNIFKDRGQKSTIRCRVYSWDKEITDTLDASAFCWHRNSGNEETDADWDRLHAGRKSIVITTEDVQDNASFYCEIKI